MKVFLVVLTCLIPTQTFAWSHHNRITEIALSSMTELQSQKILVTDFSDVTKNASYILQDLKALKSLHYQDIDEYNPALSFNENLKISKTYIFKANATSPNTNFQDLPGQQVSVADILIKYADEPDWGMDQLIFDQYPQINRSKYTEMGAADSSDPVPTQAFRHMFWEFSWKHLLATFKIPLTDDPLGQAPDRAGLFMALSQRAKELNLNYWSVRFMANALHYLEDVSQPYHSTQTATKDFIWMALFGKQGEGPWVAKTNLPLFEAEVQHILTYYHFAFEDYMALLLEKYSKDPNSTSEVKEIVGTLADQTQKDLSKNTIYSRVKNLSALAVDQARNAGTSSLDFFPPFPSKFSTFDGNAINKYMDENYWNTVYQKGHTSSPARQKYFNVVKTMYAPLGAEIRAAVKAGLN